MTTTAPKNKQPAGMPVFLFHGDKGGVGKSWTCSVFVDWLVKRKIPVAVVDGDTRNPDVSRMFTDVVPVTQANLRAHEGWMDLTDFMIAREKEAMIISLPAGIGGDFKREAPRFFDTVEMLNRPVSMFWVINRLPDSVNLLAEAMNVTGDKLHAKVVVKNLFFGDEDKFSRWDNSETRKKFESSGGKTIALSELHERTVDKLFADNESIMPFSSAVVPVQEINKSVHKLTPSENMELMMWLQENHRRFDQIQANLGL